MGTLHPVVRPSLPPESHATVTLSSALQLWRRLLSFVGPPFCAEMGRLFSSAIVLALELVPTRYSRSPIFCVPEGVTRFWLFSASEISEAAQMIRDQFCRLKIHDDGALLAAVRQRDRSALDRHPADHG